MSKGVATGIIKNKENHLLFQYTMRMLNTKHLNEILDLQQDILGQLKNPELCVYLSESEVLDMLTDLGKVVGIFVGNTIIAFACVLFPQQRKDNLGRDIGLADEILTQVAHLEFSAVHPAFRGNSLQKKMASFLIDSLLREDRWYYLLNTISPYNPISLDTDFYLGFVISRLSVKYGGLLRYILQRNLKNSLKVNKEKPIIVSASALDNQKELLNKGYCGFGFVDNSKSSIMFGKVISE